MNAAALAMPLTAPVRIHIDPARSWWYDRFFETWAFDRSADVIEAIASLEISVDAVAKSDDLARLGLSGWLYWTLYVKGFLRFEEAGTLTLSNPYVDYMLRYGTVHDHDPGVSSELSSPDRALARVERRYRDLETLRGLAGEHAPSDEAISPICCQVLLQPRFDTKTIIDCDSGEDIAASMIDGYHRLFGARLFEIRRLACDVSYEIDEMTSLT